MTDGIVSGDGEKWMYARVIDDRADKQAEPYHARLQIVSELCVYLFCFWFLLEFVPEMFGMLLRRIYEASTTSITFIR